MFLLGAVNEVSQDTCFTAYLFRVAWRPRAWCYPAVSKQYAWQLKRFRIPPHEAFTAPRVSVNFQRRLDLSLKHKTIQENSILVKELVVS